MKIQGSVSDFWVETYVVTHHKNCLSKAVLMRGHNRTKLWTCHQNISFYLELCSEEYVLTDCGSPFIQRKCVLSIWKSLAYLNANPCHIFVAGLIIIFTLIIGP